MLLWKVSTRGGWEKWRAPTLRKTMKGGRPLWHWVLAFRSCSFFQRWNHPENLIFLHLDSLWITLLTVLGSGSGSHGRSKFTILATRAGSYLNDVLFDNKDLVSKSYFSLSLRIDQFFRSAFVSSGYSPEFLCGSGSRVLIKCEAGSRHPVTVGDF